MPHRRTQIRNVIVALVETVPGLTVTNNRRYNWQLSELPAAAIYTLNEPADTVTIERTQERTLRVAVEIHVVSKGDLDTDVDDWVVLVEKAVNSDYRFSRLALGSGLVNTTIGFTGDGDNAHGVCRLEYDVVYRTDPDNPDA